MENSSREGNICFCSSPSAIHNHYDSKVQRQWGKRAEVDNMVQDAGCSCSYAGSWRPFPSTITTSELMGKRFNQVN